MEDPVLFALHRIYLDRDTKITLKHCDKISWQTGTKVLDIGCGCGSATFELLLPLLPKNFSNLTGIDISENMVEYCKSRSNDNRINFIKLDFGTSEIPEEFKNYFNHVFSFFCLHWIQDQRLAFDNIYTVLTPGGSVLINLVPYSPFFDIHAKLAKNERWVKYNDNWERFQPPYKRCNVENEIKDILTTIGFSITLCKLERKLFIFSNFPELRDFCKSVCMFIPDIPKNEVEDFMDDYMNEIRGQNDFKVRLNVITEEEEIEYQYDLLEILCFRK